MTTLPDDSTFSSDTAPRRLWENAQWQALRAVQPEDIASLDHRSHLALFVASAHFHHGDALSTNMMVRQAIDWGAARHDVVSVLLGSAQNTLGRIALLLEEPDQAKVHFRASVAPVQLGGDADKTAFVRQFHEMLSLGLLPEAAKTLSEHTTTSTQNLPAKSSWATVLESKVELLNHVLSLSLEKGQLDLSRVDTDLEQDPKAYAEKHSPAQLGQDVWVLEHCEFKRDGFFVEFGATNGILLSNSYLLETAFGWSGICAEPNPTFFVQLERNRTCKVSPDCIAGETGETVNFIAADEYGGIADYADDDMHATKRQAYADGGHVLELTTISLHDFLIKHDAPRTIDYLSIDTEGSEYEILETFPFDKWDIRLITVEHNFTPMRDKIESLLTAQGYVRTEAKWDDWYAKSAAD